MTLKEKFTNAIVLPFEYEKKVKESLVIADDYAIEFAEWICLKADVPYIKGTMDNTLEIFKKEKGL